MVAIQTVTAMQRAQQALDRALARLGSGQIEANSSINRGISLAKQDLAREIALRQARSGTALGDRAKYLIEAGAYSEAEQRYRAGANIIKNSIRDDASILERQQAVLEAERLYASIDPLYGNRLYEGTQVAFRGERYGHLAPTALGSGSDVSLVDRLFFSASNGVGGLELWSSTGEAGSEIAVGDIEPGAAGQFSAGTAPTWAAANGLLYYTATNAANGTELWRSDGTKGGTFLLADLTPGAASSSIGNMIEFKGALYFTLSQGTDHYLYKSDGLASNTARVAKIASGTATAPSSFTVVGDHLYFVSQTPASGQEVWRTDGKTSGTALVANVRSGSGSSFPAYLTASGNKLFFTAIGNTGGRELYVTDPSGTRRVADINPGSADGLPISPMMFMKAVDGGVVFAAQDPTAGLELYFSDGTSATRLTDLVPGSADTLFGGLTRIAVIDNKIAFGATTADGFYAPYFTNLAGNTQLITSDDGDALTYASHFTVAGDRLYIRAAEAGLAGSRLYRVDPTTAKATAIAGTQDIPFVNQTVIGDKIFASAMKSGIQRNYIYGADGLYEMPGLVGQGYAVLVPGITVGRLTQSAQSMTQAADAAAAKSRAALLAADRAQAIADFQSGIAQIADRARTRADAADPDSELDAARRAAERLQNGYASLSAEARSGGFLADSLQDVLQASKAETADLQARRDAKLAEAKRQQRGKLLRGEIDGPTGPPSTAGLSTIGLQVDSARFTPPPAQPAYRPVLTPIKLAGATLSG